MDGTKLPKTLTTPSGGVVRFRDLEQAPLTGRDLRKWRTLYNLEKRGDYTQRTVELLFELFVIGWEFERLPRLPLPSEDPSVIDLLTADDQFAIENKLGPLIDILNGSESRRQSKTDDTGPGSPTQPSSD